MKIEIDIDINSDSADEIVRNSLIDTYNYNLYYDDFEIKDSLIKIIDYYSNREQFEDFKTQYNIIE